MKNTRHEPIGGKRIAVCAILLFILVLAAGCSTTDEYWTLPLTRNVDFSGAGSIEGLLGGFFGCLFIDFCLLPITAAHDLWLYYKRHPEEFPSDERRKAINWYERIMRKYKE